MIRTSFLGCALGGILGVLSACSPEPVTNSYIGYVEADWVYISAPQSGWIVDRSVREGAKVEEGDILFELDDIRERSAINEADARYAVATSQAKDATFGARTPEIEALNAQLEEAQANMEKARSERSRILPLVAEGIESRLRGDQVEASLREAKARAANARQQIIIARQASRPALRNAANAQARAMLAVKKAAQYDLLQRRITAQSSAHVSEIFQQPGEFVLAGTPIMALLPAGGLKVRFFVSQANLSSIRIGQMVSVHADGLSNSVKGRVSYISPEAEFTPPVIYSKDSRGKLVFLIEATVRTGERLHPGMPVDVSLL